MFIDSHAHIYSEQFLDELPEIMKRSREHEVGMILMPAVDAASHARMLQTALDYPAQCKSMMGVHPCSIQANWEEELAVARNYLFSQPFIAVGEIGLDFYWDTTYKEQQVEAFHRQIQWALELELPICIHSRNATDECIEIIAGYVDKGLEGVFHCFSGDAIQAQQIVDLGFYLGIGGVVTFKNSGLAAALENIPLDKILLETDAPYLAPVPYRGKRNEPSYTPLVAHKLAELKNVSVAEVAAITTANTKKIFAL